MDRATVLQQLRQSIEWDVIVIGGGATGLGTAVDAASRGYRTLLLEAHDFAQGTSSRSTKLVHGGVRYLAQGDIALVRAALRERGLLKQNAPHLFHELGFVIPTYKWGEQAFYGLGLKVYDLLAGKLGLSRSRFLSRADTLAALPTIRSQGLKGGVLYFDGQFDDARLAIALMRTVFDQGGVALNYCKVTGLIKESGKVAGVLAQDAESGEQFSLRAKVVINATGVWVDAVRQMDNVGAKPMLSPSQGVHLVFDRAVLPSAQALLVPKTSDGRVLFMTPWHGRVIVGTTDTPRDDIPLEPRPFESEIDFILETANRYLTRPLTRADIKSSFVGLRPLVDPHSEHQAGAKTSALSREHTIIAAESGLVTVTGGKWTTYRLMAEQTVNLAARIASLPARACVTPTLHLHGYKESYVEKGANLDTADLHGAHGTDDVLVRALPGA
ncbi:MAG: glycerol-3-phosphate dehydrogenase/oxidase, partial [Pseudomonadota bacterium]